MADAIAVYKEHLYLAQTLDPVHVGTGDFRLGRVDNMIVRDAGTNLPKIPGSSLAGVTRAYAAMATGDPVKYRNCAGKGGPDGNTHCAQASCPICRTFGFSRKEGSFQGLAQFTDARLLFFPVYTLRGTMWLTSPAVLSDAGVLAGGASPWGELGAALLQKHTIHVPSGVTYSHLNAGWLYFQVYSDSDIDVADGPAKKAGKPGEWTIGGGKLESQDALQPILDRIAIVDDEVFPIIVEDQLEVRTSVSINPATGAAAKGALFTAEAIPRAAFLYFHVTTLDPRFFEIPKIGDSPADSGEWKTHENLNAVVGSGLSYAKWLGVGGANTRGMGRTRIEPVTGGAQ